MQEFWNTIWQLSIDFAPRLGAAALVCVVTWLLATVVKKIILRAGEKFDEGKRQVFRLAGSSGKIILLLLGGITALATLGVNVSALVAGLGLSGFALGFALKDALSNLLAGALILVYKPFQCGDNIAVAGSEGKVIEINLRYTILENGPDKYLIPNSTLYKNAIHVSGQPEQ
ncbi:MAG: mechanosensitive ion channel [Phycisphaerae bacterium]|nr:mechanosensitive ion channel [Phycisphaerae bacterium]